jgi:hypothetical protein
MGEMKVGKRSSNKREMKALHELALEIFDMTEQEKFTEIKRLESLEKKEKGYNFWLKLTRYLLQHPLKITDVLNLTKRELQLERSNVIDIHSRQYIT